VKIKKENNNKLEKKKSTKKQYNVESDVFYDAVQPEHTQKNNRKQTNKFVKFFEEKTTINN